MALKEDLQTDVRKTLATSWQSRKGYVVPDPEDVKLGNDAVTFEEAAVLYADLAESTELVNGRPPAFAAKVYKSFLHCASKIIRAHDGEITAFDGDRIMGVFLGENKRTNAANCGLKINYAVTKIINPAIKAQYSNTTYVLRHSVGIDVSRLFVARTGIRGSNDLVWVGRAANYAAKLCSVRSGKFATFITAEVFARMNDKVKYGGEAAESMWEKWYWAERGITVYRSSWWRSV